MSAAHRQRDAINTFGPTLRSHLSDPDHPVQMAWDAAFVDLTKPFHERVEDGEFMAEAARRGFLAWLKNPRKCPSEIDLCRLTADDHRSRMDHLTPYEAVGSPMDEQAQIEAIVDSCLVSSSAASSSKKKKKKNFAAQGASPKPTAPPVRPCFFDDDATETVRLLDDQGPTRRDYPNFGSNGRVDDAGFWSKMKKTKDALDSVKQFAEKQQKKVRLAAPAAAAKKE